ncbi:two-component regulator propeller domain-containing protein [candidate division CSSED10-310 bacterium]|uniref:Two-component regulator propeller domain-containing protein n=1 Tax=candidate division CSSED10-310 bacterium TaxID=2855610 RepID=A0ABV6YWU7_UNCC1
MIFSINSYYGRKKYALVQLKIFYLTTLLALGITPSLQAIDNDIKFEHISTEHILSQSPVLCIQQDQTGFMWFGTKSGLNKFDGYIFTEYNHDPENPQSLSNNDVRSILIDNAGVLWVGTRGGRSQQIEAKQWSFRSL